MKVPTGVPKNRGLTLIELVIIIALLVLFYMLLLPMKTRSRHAPAAGCMSNQRQVAYGLMMFAEDHGGQYPWQISATNGGSLEKVGDGVTFGHYRPLSPYLGKMPQVLVCPKDITRRAATNFLTLTDSNVSYFIHLTGFTTNAHVLTGDRNLQANGKPLLHGAFTYSTNVVMGWASEFHAVQRPMGVLSFTDGHAELVNNERLNSHFQHSLGSTNRFVIP